jgi:hypothetical protein
VWSGVDLNLRPLLRLSIAKLAANLAAYTALIKSSRAGEIIIATSSPHSFSLHPHSLILAFFSYGLLLSAASQSLTALLGVQSRVRFAGRPRAHRWSE